MHNFISTAITKTVGLLTKAAFVDSGKPGHIIERRKAILILFRWFRYCSSLSQLAGGRLVPVLSVWCTFRFWHSPIPVIKILSCPAVSTCSSESPPRRRVLICRTYAHEYFCPFFVKFHCRK